MSLYLCIVLYRSMKTKNLQFSPSSRFDFSIWPNFSELRNLCSAVKLQNETFGMSDASLLVFTSYVTCPAVMTRVKKQSALLSTNIEFL